MTLVSSKEFALHQKKFYNMAVKERVAIKRGKNMFYLSNACFEDESFDLADAKAAENDEDINVDDYLRRLKHRKDAYKKHNLPWK